MLFTVFSRPPRRVPFLSLCLCLWLPCLHAEDDTGSSSQRLLQSLLGLLFAGVFSGRGGASGRDHAGPRQPVLLAGIRRVPSVARR